MKALIVTCAIATGLLVTRVYAQSQPPAPDTSTTTQTTTTTSDHSAQTTTTTVTTTTQTDTSAAYFSMLSKLPTTADEFYNYQGEFGKTLSDLFAAAPLWTEDHTDTYKRTYQAYSFNVDADGVIHIHIHYTQRIAGDSLRDATIHDDSYRVNASRITAISVRHVTMPGYITTTREAYRIIISGTGRVTPIEARCLSYRRGNDPAKSLTAATARGQYAEEADNTLEIPLPCSDQQADAIGRTIGALVLKRGGFASFHPLDATSL